MIHVLLQAEKWDVINEAALSVFDLFFTSFYM